MERFTRKKSYFSLFDRMELKEELKTWISEMQENETFSKLQNIGDLAKKWLRSNFTLFFLDISSD